MAAAPLVVDRPVESSSQRDILLAQQLEHGEHHRLVRLVLAHALPEDGRFVVPAMRGAFATLPENGSSIRLLCCAGV